MMNKTSKKIFFIIRALLIVVVLTLLLLEAVLQAASLFVGKHQHKNEWLHPGNIRVLTLGDSNTYGLYLKAEQAYPALLEKQWNAHHADKPMEIINLGFPGTNSSRVLKSLPDVINTFSPDVITVMVGVNDLWFASVTTGEAFARGNPLLGWLREHSRTYKLISLLRRQVYNASLLKVDDEFRNAKFDASRLPEWEDAMRGKTRSPFPDKPAAIHYGDTTFDIGYVFDVSKKQDLAGEMRKNLALIADIARQNNIKLFFISYAYYEHPQKMANQQMQVVAKQKKIGFLNVKARFRDECSRGEGRCNELFFPDYHPSAAGHQLLADEIEADLAPLL